LLARDIDVAVTLATLADLGRLDFDDIIDVRAPAEYAEDHLPGAISLPVLNDTERAEVGTIYKQVSPFTARKLGAALVARNAASHLQGPLADRPGGWRPLVYCWRGGQRSGSFATILSQIGWRVETIAGGYKAWRKLVVEAVYDTAVPAPVIVLDGNTGTAKTALLAALAVRGVQVLDLEAMARHRGSLFGAMEGAQPSQKAFEGALALALSRLDSSRPVVVEAESSRIGSCRLPPRLWHAMTEAPRFTVVAPLAARATFLTRAYADLASDPVRLARIIASLRPVHSAEVIEGWLKLAEDGQFADLSAGLMERHYDPRYAKHRARMKTPAAEFSTPSLDAEAIEHLADCIATQIGVN
jgi:tRNA 2-selenouridine synthase